MTLDSGAGRRRFFAVVLMRELPYCFVEVGSSVKLLKLQCLFGVHAVTLCSIDRHSDPDFPLGEPP